MKSILIAALLCTVCTLAGCGMSREETIEACNYCLDNNYSCNVGINDMGYVRRVICLPPSSSNE